MLIKIKDHRIVASEVSGFAWASISNFERLEVYLKNVEVSILIEGPKTLLGMFEKQYEEIINESKKD